VTEKEARTATTMTRLGDSDLVVTECCLGTMTWGQQNTEAEAHEQLNYAIHEEGINFIDTAELYSVPAKAETHGNTDRHIGTWLKDQKRDSIVLASKVSGYSDRLVWMRDSGEGTRVRPSDIFESVDKSLSRLQTDYIDLLQIHWPDRYVPLFGAAPYDVALERDDAVPFEDQLEAMAKLIEQGKVRNVGVSNETSWGVSEFSRLANASGGSLPKICSIQNSYSLLVRTPFETNLSETCSPRNCNVSLLAYSPLAGGSLTGKYLADEPPEGARFSLFDGYMDRFNKSLAREAVKEYAQVAEKHGLTPTQLAIAFCRSRWFVGSTIVGATSKAQLKENIDAFALELSDECLAEIEEVHKKYRDPSSQ